MINYAETAREIFQNNFNCAQAVFAAIAPDYGLSKESALKLGSPFGGGIAHRGETCGAVTGALLALGLARSSGTPATKEEIYRLSNRFLERFEEQHQSLLCRELIHQDLLTPEGYQKAVEAWVFRSICPLLVGDAAALVQALLEED